MSIDLDKKYKYKLRNKKSGSTYSSGRKATWARPLAVVDIIKGKNGFRNDSLDMDEWEILLYPMDNPLTIDAKDFVQHYQDKVDDKIKKLVEMEKTKQRLIREKREADEKELLKTLKAKYPDV